MTREAFQPEDLDFPRSLPPTRAPRPLFSPSGNTPPTCHVLWAGRGVTARDEFSDDYLDDFSDLEEKAPPTISAF